MCGKFPEVPSVNKTWICCPLRKGGITTTFSRTLCLWLSTLKNCFVHRINWLRKKHVWTIFWGSTQHLQRGEAQVIRLEQIAPSASVLIRTPNVCLEVWQTGRFCIDRWVFECLIHPGVTLSLLGQDQIDCRSFIICSQHLLFSSAAVWLATS